VEGAVYPVLLIGYVAVVFYDFRKGEFGFDIWDSDLLGLLVKNILSLHI